MLFDESEIGAVMQSDDGCGRLTVALDTGTAAERAIEHMNRTSMFTIHEIVELC